MNRDFIPLSELTGGPTYWCSLEELHGAHRAKASDDDDDDPTVAIGSTSRRRFLELMGASLGLAGLTGCTRQPTQFIVPYVDPPEHAIPGRPIYFATAVPLDGIAQGVIVETHLGRPTKVEGNPAHPGSLGATSVHSQATVLDLYDPDRAREVTWLGQTRGADDLTAALRKAIAPLGANGAGLHILTQTVCAPTLASQLAAVSKALPGAKWHQYYAAGRHSARAGAQLAFGRYVNTAYRLDSADVVVALDADFLACGPVSTRLARDFALRRRRGDRLDMNRLYAVESSLTSTGGKADHRLPVRWAEVDAVARSLAAAVGVPGVGPAAAASNYQPWITPAANDLMAHRGACAVIPGDDQSAAVHALAHAINTSLGNIGQTVILTEPLEAEPVDQIASLKDLVASMDAGQVTVLLILGGNPAYDAPADLAFSDHLRKVGTVFHLSQHLNETSVLCDWHIPERHTFEDWSDARAFDGTVSIVQPLIEPLYGSQSAVEILDALLQFPPRSSYEIVRAYWAQEHKGADFEAWWRKSVHDGLIEGSALPEIKAAAKTDWSALPPPPQHAGIEIVFRTDPYMQAGAYTNNGWLQELPQPITKLTWDNAAHISPATAKRLNIESRDKLRLTYRGRTIEAPAWVAVGHPNDTVTVHLGYGHTHLGKAANGSGFNANMLRTSDALWSGGDLRIEKTGASWNLATTQMQQYMEGRTLVIEDTVDTYRREPDFVRRLTENPGPRESLYPPWGYTGYAWGMSIDLTACVNCNACVVACQAENNIPVVGKEQVLSRRAMHWIRIDTYFKGNGQNPSVFYQPVPCQQCEDAPCELVCPVQATQHSSDGLNDMVYNRCIGTRYCSNNCPYKVRRFNFLLFQDWVTESIKLQRNPDVTVRSRGVMEKCTYCVQRIREGEIRSEDQDRFIRDGEVQTACQQACPTQAIVFGDINQKANRVAKLKEEKLNYALLAELNTRPRTTYLAELHNPNPAISRPPVAFQGDPLR